MTIDELILAYERSANAAYATYKDRQVRAMHEQAQGHDVESRDAEFYSGSALGQYHAYLLVIEDLRKLKGEN